MTLVKVPIILPLKPPRLVWGGEIEIRLDAVDGHVIGRSYFHHTGDTSYFLPYKCDLNSTINGVHEVYMNCLKSRTFITRVA